MQKPQIIIRIASSDAKLLRAIQMVDATCSIVSKISLFALSSGPIPKVFFPFAIILFRMREVASSAKLLLCASNIRDAKTLLLTLIELRLDAMFLHNDLARVDAWFDHHKENKKPWRVSDQMETLFQGRELEGEKWLYIYCSMVKHGNPAGGTTSFPLGVSEGWLCINRPDVDSSDLINHLFWLVSECTRVAKVALEVMRLHGREVDYLVEECKCIESQQSEEFERNLLEMVWRLLARNNEQSRPERER